MSRASLRSPSRLGCQERIGRPRSKRVTTRSAVSWRKVVGVEAAGEVDCAGAGLGQAQAGVDRVFHRIHPDE